MTLKIPIYVHVDPDTHKKLKAMLDELHRQGIASASMSSLVRAMILSRLAEEEAKMAKFGKAKVTAWQCNVCKFPPNGKINTPEESLWSYTCIACRAERDRPAVEIPPPGTPKHEEAVQAEDENPAGDEALRHPRPAHADGAGEARHLEG